MPLFKRARLQFGETVLVTGAAGGVGLRWTKRICSARESLQPWGRQGGYATLDRTNHVRGLLLLDPCSREPLTSLDSGKRSGKLMRTSGST